MGFVPEPKPSGVDPVCRWEDVVDSHYVLQLQQQRPIILKADEEAVGQLRNVPKVWSLEHDEALVQLMAQHIPRDNDALGAIKSFVEHVDVSSYCVSAKKEKVASPLTQMKTMKWWMSPLK